MRISEACLPRGGLSGGRQGLLLFAKQVERAHVDYVDMLQEAFWSSGARQPILLPEPVKGIHQLRLAWLLRGSAAGRPSSPACAPLVA